MPSHGIIHGDHHGVLHGVSRGGMVGVAKDATSGVYCPATAAQWTTTMSAAGLALGAPSNLWLFQEAASPFADTIGGISVASTGTVNTQQSVSGWTRKGISPAAGAANSVNATNAALADGVHAVTLIAYVSITAAPAGDSDVMLIGDGSGLMARVTASNTPKLAINLGGTPVTATGASAVGTVVRPWVLGTDGNSAGPTFTTLRDDLETVPLGSSHADVSAANKIWFGGVLTNAPSMQVVYAAQWVGTAMTDAQVRVLLRQLGWTIPW